MNEAHLCLSSPSVLTMSPEYTVQAEEGGQAVLDCFLPWHQLLLDKPEYHYTWAQGAPGTTKVTQPEQKY